MDGKKPFSAKNSNLFFVILFCVGGLMFYGADVGLPYLGSKLSQEKYPWLHTLLSYHLPALKHLALFFVYISGGALVLKFIFGGIWQTYLQTPIEGIKKFFERHSAPSDLSACTSSLDYENFINQASAGLYGPHVNKDTSFYTFLRQNLLDPFCNEPYKSDFKKRIEVTDHPNIDDYVNWHEITEWTIIDPMIDEKKRSGIFEIEYETSSYAPGMVISNWAGAVSLLIRVNNKRILKSSDTPIERNDRDNEGFFCWKENEWVTLRFYKRLILDATETPIYIEEKSINSRQDRTFMVNTRNPIHGNSLEFNLPDYNSFLKDIYISTQVLWGGLPKFAKKDLEIEKLVKKQQNSDNHIFIDIKGWILPGIVLSLNWTEIPKLDGYTGKK